jgi:hypothetical protein
MFTEKRPLGIQVERAPRQHRRGGLKAAQVGRSICPSFASSAASSVASVVPPSSSTRRGIASVRVTVLVSPPKQVRVHDPAFVRAGPIARQSYQLADLAQRT